MIRKFAWYTKDLPKRRVVLMHDRRAVQLLEVTGVTDADMATVAPLRNGRRPHVVRVSELYEPREGEMVYYHDVPLD